MNATKDVHIVLIFFLYDIQNYHSDESWFFDCVTITSTWYLQTLLILHLMFYVSLVQLCYYHYCVVLSYISLCLSVWDCDVCTVLSCLVVYLYTQNIFNADWFYILCHISLERLSSSDNKSVSHWIMFDYFFSCLKSKHFFLFNYVPHLFLLTCVKFHGKKIDNNNYILTNICLPSFFQMASYDSHKVG